MPKFFIQHVTKYTYAEPVRDSANQIMLYPLKDEHQEVLSHRIIISGEPPVEVFTDYYGNEAGSFMNIAPHTELRIDSNIVVITKPIQWPADDVDIARQWEYLPQIKNVVPFIDFLKQESFSALPQVKQIADDGFFHSVSVFVAARQLNEYVYNNFKYIKGVTTVETTLDEIWNLKAGVCQDFAHMLLVMLRLLGIPARYVSGYVCAHENDMRGEGATHAWVDAYLPFYGWIGLDPTNNCIVNDRHVRLAIGRSFSDCSPVKGTYKGTGRQTLEVGVSVSYQDSLAPRMANPVLTAQEGIEVAPLNPEDNSYRRYMQMIQQQQ